MGLDLRLLVIDGELPDRPYSHTCLSLDRTGITEPVQEIEEKRGETLPGLYCNWATIPDGKWEGEHSYGEATETPYGEPLHWVFVRHLKPLKDHESVTGSRLNKAAWAYLCALPDLTRVVLYWH